MTRKADPLRKLQRNLYLAQRTIGDYRSFQRGRLAKRLVRRSVTRSILGPALGRLFRGV